VNGSARWPQVLAAALLGLLVVLAWWAPLDAAAERQVDAGLKRALATFAAARALNALISVAQGTEVALEPAGVGVTFTPGQALDPINDLIEQFSLLMLGASVSFGLQRVLVGVGGWWPVSLALTLAVAAFAWQRQRGAHAPRWLARALVLLVVVRFAVPAVALGSEAVFRLFLAEAYASGQAQIELSSRQVAGQLPQAGGEAGVGVGVGERLQRWWRSAPGFDVGKRIDELKDAASRAVEHVVTLIVVFLLQTLVVPLALLWLVWRGAGAALARLGR
jgi:hypothetical protein